MKAKFKNGEFMTDNVYYDIYHRFKTSSIKRKALAEVLKENPYNGSKSREEWIDEVFDKANELTKKLMEEIE